MEPLTPPAQAMALTGHKDYIVTINGMKVGAVKAATADKALSKAIYYYGLTADVVLKG